MSTVPAVRKRIEELDILKALGIICMVAGHSGVPCRRFIYLFHMAAFFIASGFFYKSSSSDDTASVMKGVVNKLKQLWLPFFIWGVIYILLHNFFLKINVYTDNPLVLNYSTGMYNTTIAPYTFSEIVKRILKALIFSCGEPMLGAGWFLRILFVVSVAYLICDYLIKLLFKKHVLLIQAVVSAVLLAFGYYCSLKDMTLLGIAQGASFYWLYYAGHLLALNKDRYSGWTWKQHLPVFICSFGLLLWLSSIGSVAFDQNKYVNPLFLIAASLSGWCLLYSISFFLKHISVLKRILTGIGKRTLTILLLHFLCMKIVSAIIVAYYGLPSFCIAVFPYIYGDRGLWWLAYTVIGVGLPVAANILYHYIIDKTRPLFVKKTA